MPRALIASSRNWPAPSGGPSRAWVADWPPVAATTQGAGAERRDRQPDSGRLAAGTVLIDACCLVGPLHRRLILAAAGATGQRLAWSARIVTEAEYGIARMLAGREDPAAAIVALHADLARCGGLVVPGDAPLPPGLPPLRDPGDAHVLAAALAAGASLILTENRRDFPPRLLRPLGLRAMATDAWGVQRLSGPALAALGPAAALRAAGLLHTAARLRGVEFLQ